MACCVVKDKQQIKREEDLKEKRTRENNRNTLVKLFWY